MRHKNLDDAGDNDRVYSRRHRENAEDTAVRLALGSWSESESRKGSLIGMG